MTFEKDFNLEQLSEEFKKILVDAVCAVFGRAESHETLKWLSSNLEQSLKLMVICVFRPPFEIEISMAKKIMLGLLTHETILEIIKESRINLKEKILNEVIKRAAGNPLYLVELLKSISRQANAEILPSSIRALVMSRFDALNKASRLITQLASTAKGRLSTNMTDSITRRLGFNYYSNLALSELVQRGFLQCTNDYYEFPQAVVEDVILSSKDAKKYPEILFRSALSAWQMIQMTREDSSHYMKLTAELLTNVTNDSFKLQYQQLTLAEVLARMGRKDEARKCCEAVYSKIKYNEKKWFLDWHQRIIYCC